MPNRCLLCYITDRAQFAGDEAAQRALLLTKIAESARCGVDFIQLREKDLGSRQLELLAIEAMQVIAANITPEACTRLLINSRTDVAMAVGADGVHLRSDDVCCGVVRAIYEAKAMPICIGVSCHSAAEVASAERQVASFAVFGPVFEKRHAPSVQSTGLAALRQACAFDIPVLALGGVTLSNARECLNAGAAGIAGIRIFQDNDVAEVVRRLRDQGF